MEDVMETPSWRKEETVSVGADDMGDREWSVAFGSEFWRGAFGFDVGVL